MAITEGQGQFELPETLRCEGYLHVTLYSVPEGKAVGGLYFGTAQQMKEIEHWNVRSWYTSELNRHHTITAGAESEADVRTQTEAKADGTRPAAQGAEAALKPLSIVVGPKFETW